MGLLSTSQIFMKVFPSLGLQAHMVSPADSWKKLGPGQEEDTSDIHTFSHDLYSNTGTPAEFPLGKSDLSDKSFHQVLEGYSP
ncbi:hypothetical protein WISP_39796 [Willisornis vidua]|uniref:Uncharacterized protein n=1 Tax=Willisornis vidua TaxID=1566151 RepID=A0ABQ9DNN8_9PASS|nr:hypothetical protein WISP_39796 [Willisornis vidua]